MERSAILLKFGSLPVARIEIPAQPCAPNSVTSSKVRWLLGIIFIVLFFLFTYLLVFLSIQCANNTFVQMPRGKKRGAPVQLHKQIPENGMIKIQHIELSQF